MQQSLKFDEVYITKEKYEYAQARIDALLPLITENTPMDDPMMIELMMATDIVEAFETEHCPIAAPTLCENHS